MRVNPWNDTMQRAITEVQACIRAIYPDATFRLVEGEDPPGFYLDVYTDAEERHDFIKDVRGGHEARQRPHDTLPMACGVLMMLVISKLQR